MSLESPRPRPEFRTGRSSQEDVYLLAYVRDLEDTVKELRRRVVRLEACLRVDNEQLAKIIYGNGTQD